VDGTGDDASIGAESILRRASPKREGRDPLGHYGKAPMATLKSPTCGRVKIPRVRQKISYLYRAQRSNLIPFSSGRFEFISSQVDSSLFKAVAFAFEPEEMPPVKKAIQDSRGGGIVPEEFPPVLQDAIRSDDGAFSGGIPIQDDIQQVVGCLFRDLLAQEQVIDNQQIGFGEEPGHLFSPFELIGLEEILEKGMGFPVDDLIACLDGGMRDGFGDMALSGSRRSDQEGVMAVLNELAAHQFIDFLLGQLRVEAPIKLGESGSFFEAGSLEAGFGETGVAAIQLVLHQTRKHL
jgi:hypothetical protein